MTKPMNATKPKMSFRFLMGAAIALTFLWTASASALYVSLSKHQSSNNGSNGPTITLSNQIDLSRIHWGSSGAVSPVTTNISGNPFADAIHQLLVTKITFTQGGWSSDSSSSLIEYFFPSRDPKPRPPSNAVPEPQAALLFAVGVGVTSVLRKRRS